MQPSTISNIESDVPDETFLNASMTRRKFLQRCAIAGAGVLGAGTWATEIEPEWIEVARVPLPIANLHPAFEGWKLAQISDLHVGGWMTRERLQHVVDKVNALRPELVAITGDFATRAAQRHSPMISEVLSTLEPRVEAFGVLGNHDHWTNPKIIREALRKSGVQELENSFHTIRRDGGVLHLCGLDDAWIGAADVSRVLETLPAANRKTGGSAILLAHEPDFADEYSRAGRFDVQLSGHSHGGQIQIPLVGPIHLPLYGEKYHTGRYQVGNGSKKLTLYVNRGVGMVWPYVRFHCRPEITLFTLHAL